MGSFSANVAKFVERTGVKADTVLRKLAFDAYRGVMMKSPVDTGRFRASWRVGINEVDSSVNPPIEGKVHRDAAGRLRDEGVRFQKDGGGQRDGEGKINKAKWGDSIWITNNLPYAEPLEKGHSQQAPHGMLLLTFNEIKANLERIVRSVA